MRVLLSPAMRSKSRKLFDDLERDPVNGFYAIRSDQGIINEPDHFFLLFPDFVVKREEGKHHQKATENGTFCRLIDRYLLLPRSAQAFIGSSQARMLGCGSYLEVRNSESADQVVGFRRQKIGCENYSLRFV